MLNQNNLNVYCNLYCMIQTYSLYRIIRKKSATTPARRQAKAQISQSIDLFDQYLDKMSDQFLQELVLAITQEALGVYFVTFSIKHQLH